MAELGALVLSLGTLVLQQSPSNQATDAVSWPVTGVERPGQGVSSPILLHETKPNYTAAAMRARIQGVVVMECVVEVDGSIGPVRVTRSLDTVYGLDDEAVRTLRQWRFRPGTREGTPVRVAVAVEISFTLRDRREPTVAPSPVPAPLGWPPAFSDASEVSDTLPSGWVEESVETPLISARFARPPDWLILTPPALNPPKDGRLATLHADNAGGNRTVTISQSGPAPVSLSTPLSQSMLDSFFNQMAQRGYPAGLKPIQSGQVGRSNGIWVWFELAAPAMDFSHAPPAAAEYMRSRYSGVHIWAFATTVNGQIVDVLCSVLHRLNAPDQEKADEVRRAALEFGAILRRINVQPR